MRKSSPEGAQNSSDGDDRNQLFGLALRALREGYAIRIVSGGALKVNVSQLAVMRSLEHGRTSGTYSLLESGSTLPRNPAQFTGELATAYGLNNRERDELMTIWTISRLSRKLGLPDMPLLMAGGREIRTEEQSREIIEIWSRGDRLPDWPKSGQEDPQLPGQENVTEPSPTHE